MKGLWAAILSGWLVGGSLADWFWLVVVHMLVGWLEGSVGWHIEVFCRLVYSSKLILLAMVDSAEYVYF